MTNDQVPPPIVGGRPPGRNEPCPCESGLKYKHCHGDAVKESEIKAVTFNFYNKLWANAITLEQMKRGLRPYPFVCESCSKGCLRPEESKVSPGSLLCLECGGIVQRTQAEECDGKEIEIKQG